LINALVENCSLSVLNLQANGLNEEVAVVLGQLLAQNTTLVELNLAANELGHFGGEVLVVALEGNAACGLTKLCLSGIKSLAIDSRIRLVNWSNVEPQRQVNLDGYEQIESALRAALNDCKMDDLSLQSCHLCDTDADWIEILLASNTKLKRLNLSHNCLGNVAAAAIIRGLATNTTVTDLQLQFNAFEGHGISTLRKLQKTNTRCTVHLSTPTPPWG